MVVRALRSLQSSDSFMSRFPAFGGTEVKVNERHDIVMRPTTEDNWLKVSGSAFKLTRGRALHHGTLLVASPYLSQISPLLNSLYKDNFTLKGVSSVRSPVGNLFSGECSEPGRDELSQAVQQAIISEFSELYAAGGGIEAMQLSDQDCHESENASIAQGVKELQSDEWRFCQTPRFSFRCPSGDSRFAGFEVNRGYIERISLDYDDDNDPVSIDVSDVSGLGKIYLHDLWGPIDMVLPDLAKAYSDAKNEPDYEKLSDKELDHHGPYWRSFLEALMTSEEDRGKLDDCFPDWSSRKWRIGVI
ncbi:uncharacterized protein HMPREF1541_00454 [Cyphellophora europaea CBS 101466]|uniref:Putative lipoate-protein ligase A n=1 Tax=Cyphellophora europaea (strain CBS 101466) TaxID=1220924 RepID=W2SCD1_CYPE1|nr:uncharacterized protein HMPREF1541_00454 [Cyphellophora europaea CBS 101466]ETN46270.1 hypothetical protein HMPREF1541_00454 [Cyphellophora europaea CBS 101466]